MKACNKCGETKPAKEFHKDKHKTDGLCTTCKSCKRAYRKSYYSENREKAVIDSKSWYKSNRDKAAKARKIYRLRNIEKSKRIRKSQYWKNPEKAKEQNKIYARERARVDPVYRLRLRCRKRIWAAFKEGGYSKNSSSFDMIGCSIDELTHHLESKFTKGMSWDNYGEWHVDHIVPLASANTESEVIALCHYTNLQPLWANENLSKGAKIL